MAHIFTQENPKTLVGDASDAPASIPTPDQLGSFLVTTDGAGGDGKLYAAVRGPAPEWVPISTGPTGPTGMGTTGPTGAAGPTGSDAGTPNLAAVLAVGNDSGPSDILLQPAQNLDTDVPGTLQIGTVNATVFSTGNPVGSFGLFQMFINQGGTPLHGSNSGIQYSSTFSSRAQVRLNQYGAAAGVPGISTFKSRGTAVGALASVIVGDVIYRATAVGVCGDNASIPLSGFISINVVGVAPTFISTEYEIQLVPLEGPINGRKVMWKVTSQGVPCIRETALPAGGKAAGVAVLDAAGVAVVANPSVKANTRFNLTAQDGGSLLTGSLQQSARIVGVNFTIRSTAGAADAGVQVYYQLWEQI